MSKVIQIAMEPDATSTVLMYALQDDGSLWKMKWQAESNCYVWEQMPEPPSASQRIYGVVLHQHVTVAGPA